MAFSNYLPSTGLMTWRHPFARIRGASLKERFTQTFRFLAGETQNKNTSRLPHLGFTDYALVLPFVLYAFADATDSLSKIPYIGKGFGFISSLSAGGFWISKQFTYYIVALVGTALCTPGILVAHGLSWFTKYDVDTVANKIQVNQVDSKYCEIDQSTGQLKQNLSQGWKRIGINQLKIGRDQYEFKGVIIKISNVLSTLKAFFKSETSDFSSTHKLLGILIDNKDHPLQSATILIEKLSAGIEGNERYSAIKLDSEANQQAMKKLISCNGLKVTDYVDTWVSHWKPSTASTASSSSTPERNERLEFLNRLEALNLTK